MPEPKIPTTWKYVYLDGTTDVEEDIPNPMSAAWSKIRDKKICVKVHNREERMVMYKLFNLFGITNGSRKSFNNKTTMPEELVHYPRHYLLSKQTSAFLDDEFTRFLADQEYRSINLRTLYQSLRYKGMKSTWEELLDE